MRRDRVAPFKRHRGCLWGIEGGGKGLSRIRASSRACDCIMKVIAFFPSSRATVADLRAITDSAHAHAHCGSACLGLSLIELRAAGRRGLRISRFFLSPLIAFPFRCTSATLIVPPLRTRLLPPFGPPLPLSDSSPTFSWPSLGEGGKENVDLSWFLSGAGLLRGFIQNATPRTKSSAIIRARNDAAKVHECARVLLLIPH